MRFILLIFTILSTYIVTAAPLTLKDDARYCGFVPRASDGTIKRSTTVLAQFQQMHPCPSTGLTTGSCPQWSMDHVIPLSTGGCDAVINVQWLPLKIKSCKDDWCKDRWERKIQILDPTIPGFKATCCSTQLITFPVTLP